MADSPRKTDPKHEQPARPADRRTRAGAAYDVQTAPAAPENGRRTELRVGDQFGRYRIERLLGEGAMGAVYLAHDETLHRPVALKIPTFPASDTDGRIRFVREARSAAALHHAHICPIHDVGEIDGTQYLTMAFIDGQPLTRVVASEKRLSMRQIALFIRKLALALQEAHTAGIIHRDLKPANIMVDRKGDPVVMDFGLARSFHGNATGRITQSGALVGSPAYMSPEQAQGRVEELGPASDIYSLGVILYELITGRLPFDGTLFQILNGIVNDPPPPMRPLRPDLDADLEAICLRMMAKEPTDRFGSMKDVADALKAALGTMGSKNPGEAPNRSAQEMVPPVATRTLGATAGQDEPDYWDQPLAEAPLPRARVRDGKSPPVAARTSFRDRIPGGDRWFLAIAISGGVAIGMVMLGIVIWISITRRGDPSDPTAPDPAGTVATTTTGNGNSTSPIELTAPSELPAIAKENRSSTTSRSAPSGGSVVVETNTAGSVVAQAAPDAVLSPTIGMKLVRIPSGEYLRGTPDSDKDALDDEKPQHRVKITQDFYLGIDEVTQGEWKAVMGTEPWKGLGFVKEGNDYPATYVSWDDAQEFVKKLSQKDGRTYRLPTAAEWEYAARGGTTTRYSFGDDESKLGEYAWFYENAYDIGETYAHVVGRKKPNPFGLFDMHGNVWEWCSDGYDKNEYAKHAGKVVADPQGPFGQTLNRVSCGGSWNYFGTDCRSARHIRGTPGIRDSNLGFRVAAVR